MERLGAVIRFKEDVTKEEAVEAIEAIYHLLDVPTVGGCSECDDVFGLIREYDDEDGTPVWFLS